ncbi:MAG: DUF5677 domain-containing protein [Beijerinckiaceae bacterium]|nr:DUF5677 domain-containing protein [Beijerinckiaceae bacterium]
MTSTSTKLAFIRDHYGDGVLGKEIFPEVTSIEHTNNPLAKVSDFFLRKATKTLDAICVLCEAGFPEDALVLGRTIFELSLHLKWIALPDLIEQQRLRAESFIYDGDRQRVEKLNGLGKLKQQGKCIWWITQIEDTKPDLQTIPKPKNFIPLKKLKDMATDLGDPWECWYLYTYGSVSKLVHPSGSGSHTYLQYIDQEEVASRALSFAIVMHYYLTDTVLSLLGLETHRPRLEEFMKGFISEPRPGMVHNSCRPCGKSD